MARDKIAVLLSSWIETQHCRFKKMVKFHGRVNLEGSTFYASLIINKDYLIIDPDDETKNIHTFNASRLNGTHEFRTKGIKVTRGFRKSSFYIRLKSTRVRDILIQKLRTLIGDESTGSSESTGTPESTESQDQDN
ncbi:hypothetical protein Zmor_005285 [Zophobas morio]|uniref:Uncharacterized protein n=1 Tax=Zophobas morio TaxID=2755281 RepID=A0AA38ISM7_9CUCU|nr:hypothetical protein Zmor_005285 [Zophobas morio]